ncbi:LysE/ArgO family amino acid transporter [Vibrio salinus]|uniref:LysE/ArgO family amino acid transporter n=1 Tax=Vibrio salinus TaxID=2899784 RepID=UPI001E4B742F|nr:LysE/ArgO family amino acid transporter [Vibrio salinus]MCE0494970.1 LysE/ArgO family amino acid transporter [Vibrio salinus]
MLASSIVTGFTTGAGLIVCIGSQNAFVLRQGLMRSHTGVVASVCILSDVLLILAGISGLGFIVSHFPGIIEFVRYAGALFLGMNAVVAARRAWSSQGVLNPSSDRHHSRRQILLTSLGYTWLNPHVYLDTVFMLGSLSLHYEGTGKWQFGVGAMLASVVWFISISYGAKILLPLFRSEKAWRLLDVLIALLMGYFCLSLLLIPVN